MKKIILIFIISIQLSGCFLRTSPPPPPVFKKGEVIISVLDGKKGMVCDLYYSKPAIAPPHYKYYIRFNSDQDIIRVEAFEIKKQL